jgi:two-component system chemotaxis response regulator CheY
MPKVMIVDDSLTVRKLLKALFGKIDASDFHFEEAENGALALEKLLKDPADLVLTDFDMPEMDGLTLLRKLKGFPLLSDIPVLVVSAMSNAKVLEFEQAGVRKVFFKPLNEAKFLETIREVFPRYKI